MVIANFTSSSSHSLGKYLEGADFDVWLKSYIQIAVL